MVFDKIGKYLGFKVSSAEPTALALLIREVVREIETMPQFFLDVDSQKFFNALGGYRLAWSDNYVKLIWQEASCDVREQSLLLAEEKAISKWLQLMRAQAKQHQEAGA
jgi:hypothetical protein